MIFFRRMLKSSLLICSVYTLIFTFVLYMTSAYTLKNGFSDRVNALMEHTSSKLTDYLLTSQEILGACLTDTTVSAYASNSRADYQNFQAVHEFLRESARSYVNPYYMISLSKISDNRVISNTNTMSLSYFQEYLGFSSEAFSGLLRGFDENPQKSTACLVSTVDQEDIFTFVVHSYETEPLYLFFSFRFSDILDLTALNSGTMVIGIDDSVVYAHGALPAREIPDLFRGQAVSGSSIFLLPQEYPSALGTLRYGYVITNNEYLSALNRNFFTLLLLGFVTLLLGYCFAYFLTKRTYSPIKVVLSSIGGKPLTRKDNELAYISDTIQDVTATNRSLRLQLASHQLSIKDRFIRGLLFGQLSPAAIQKGLLDFHLTRIKAPFVACILEYTNYDSLLENLSKDSIILVKETIFKILDRGFSGFEYRKILDLSTDRLAVIAATETRDSLLNQMKRLLTQIESDLDVELFASIGSTATTISGIDRSFADALYVSQHRVFGLQYSTICTMDDIKSVQNTMLFYPVETENAIIEKTIGENKDSIMKLIDSLLDKNFPEHIFSKEQFTQFSLMLTSTFQRIIAGLNKHPEDIFPDGTIIFLELKSCAGIPDLRAKIAEILDYILTDINAQKESLNEKTAKAMRSFVEKNYTKDISLCDLSEHLNVSQEHASRLFKKLIGDNFKNYLSHYRYWKAKEIMDNTPTIKIKEVAALVGCNNSDMLSRIFLKYEGVSAGEYLKRAK